MSNNDSSTPAKEAGAAESTAAPNMLSLVGALALYVLARLVLVVAIAVVIYFVGGLFVQVPIIVAAMFGVLIALPVGMFVFKSLRLRVNEQITAIDADRRARRTDLESRLRGGR